MVGGNWPSTTALWMVDGLTWKQCDGAEGACDTDIQRTVSTNIHTLKSTVEQGCKMFWSISVSRKAIRGLNSALNNDPCNQWHPVHKDLL